MRASRSTPGAHLKLEVLKHYAGRLLQLLESSAGVLRVLHGCVHVYGCVDV